MVIALILTYSNSYAGDCTESPDIKALKKLEPQFKVGDLIQVNSQTENPTSAEIVQVIPWWNSADCTWNVNYRAHVVTVFTFSEGATNVKLAQPGGRQ